MITNEEYQEFCKIVNDLSIAAFEANGYRKISKKCKCIEDGVYCIGCDIYKDDEGNSRTIFDISLVLENDESPYPFFQTWFTSYMFVEEYGLIQLYDDCDDDGSSVETMVLREF